jgi:uncharacterized iron-regulated protein
MKLHARNQLFLAIFCTALFSLTACTMSQQPIGNPEAPYPPANQPVIGDIYHLPTGVKVTPEQMLAAIADTRIIYVGETHDNPASHRLELQILEAVQKRYPGQVSLGMEMFNHEQQAVLDEWVAGKLSEKDFLKTSDWYGVWSLNFAYYRDILNFARDHQIQVVGLNVTKQLRQKVGMTDFAALDEATRAQLPEMDLNDRYQRAMTEAIYADHSHGGNMLDGFLRIQTLWDETMADNVARVMRDKGPGYRMVVMAGGNHVRYGFGIPRRVYRRLPTSYALVGSREIDIPEAQQDKLMDVHMPQFPMVPYDYLVYTEYESLPGEAVKLGVSMKAADGKVVVEGVVPNSTADKAGVLAGDVVVSLGGVLIEDSFDLIYEVNQRTGGDRATLTVERNGQKIDLEATFIPLPKAEGHGLESKHKD